MGADATDVAAKVQAQGLASGEATSAAGEEDGAELRPVDIAFAESMLRQTGAEGELLAGAVARACWAPSAGHLCADLEPDEMAAIEQAPSTLVRGPGDTRRTPLVTDGAALYLERCWEVESTLVNVVQRRAAIRTDIDDAEAERLVDRVFSNDPREAGGRAAVKVALTRQLAVITGGPGTGKTTVVKCLLECLALRGGSPRIALAAPTGKAADRLAEQVQGVQLPLTKSTLHSLLGVLDLESGRFRHGPSHPIAADVVVLDEASMVDAAMMARLLSALWPDTRVVLLGDPDQLRSVDYGAVLGDICRAATHEPLAGAVARLTHVWRTDGKGIHALSDAIRRQDPDAALAALHNPEFPDVERVEPKTRGPKGLETLIWPRVEAAWGDLARLEPEEGLKRLRSLRILCAHRQGARGVGYLNELVRGWLVAAGKISSRSLWYEGRPLLIGRNDAAMDLRNGNVGLVRDGQAWFDLDGLRALPPSLLPDHETLYASTVHKAQGSEAQDVIVLLPTDESPLLTRELLYTAITRAIGRVTIVGSEDIVATAIKTSAPRMSGVLRRLQGP
jgi:exodeoxyribonuclease V alpha subunit